MTLFDYAEFMNQSRCRACEEEWAMCGDTMCMSCRAYMRWLSIRYDIAPYVTWGVGR